MAALKLVYTHESPTGVYFFLAELLEDFCSTCQHRSQTIDAKEARSLRSPEDASCVVRLCMHAEEVHDSQAQEEVKVGPCNGKIVSCDRQVSFS